VTAEVKHPILTALQIPSITCVFIVTAPRPNFLHSPGTPHIHFSGYNKNELLQILSSIEPTPQLPGGPKETKDVWTRFCPAVWDSLSKHSGRDIVSFRSVCLRLWPKFVAPVLDGSQAATPFSRLLVANRSLFQNDNVLIPSIVFGASNRPATTTASAQTQTNGKLEGIGTQLPYHSRLLLVAAYLASFNPPRTDQLFFMKSAAAKRRKKGGGTALPKGRPGATKYRKISRKLLGPQAFVLERMLAIFHAIKEDADDREKFGTGREVTAGAADIQMAIATLASLRLLVKIGAANAADALDGGSRYRVAVGWEVVRGIARSVGLEAEDYLAD
jgi:origin recognition complex subunit 5